MALDGTDLIRHSGVRPLTVTTNDDHKRGDEDDGVHRSFRAKMLKSTWLCRGNRRRSFRMKNLFDPAVVEELKVRMASLTADSERQWGKMNPAQMLAHCSATTGMATGEITPPRILLGRLFGRLAKKSLIVNGTPMRRNSMTEKSCLVTDERDFVAEKQRLRETIDRFATGGPGICTQHPHFFFGPLTPLEWATLMYQHLDHHLRQFGV
jgi:hypothetical protein